MLRFLLRFAGLVAIAAAFAIAVVDGSRSIAGGRALFYPMRDLLTWLGGPRLAPKIATIDGWPEPARVLVAGGLAMPGWAVAAAIGAALLYAGRSPDGRRGFSDRRT